MYYSNGNYEAFARPEKPEGIEKKSAYIVGTGLAGLAAACFLVRDAQMPGKNIHIFESDPVPGGACDGAFIEKYGFVCRGGGPLVPASAAFCPGRHPVFVLRHTGRRRKHKWIGSMILQRWRRC